jgi:Fe-S-cluster-containing dehydrogenase component
VRAKELVGGLRVESEDCIGCGLWLPRCPEEIRALARREMTHEPPQDCAALLEKAILRKGREVLYKTQFS